MSFPRGRLIAMVGSGVLVAASITAPLAAQSNMPVRPRATDDVAVHPALSRVSNTGTRPELPVRRPVGLQHVRTVSDSVRHDAPTPATNGGHGSSLALMGVGGAAVVVGLLVGGDGGAAVAIGGGVLGLVGLYRYLR